MDTSAIIDGWIRYYPPDVFPPLWDKLDELIRSGDLRATEEVLEELKKQDDAVHKWAAARDEMFCPLDEPVQLAAAEVLKKHQRLVDNRMNRPKADPFVIALAKVNGCIVITGERATGSLDRPNIPDVCNDLRIACSNMLGLFRDQRWVFPVLATK